MVIGQTKEGEHGRAAQRIATDPNKSQKFSKFCALQVPGNFPHIIRKEISPTEIDSNNRLTLYPSFFAVFSGGEGSYAISYRQGRQHSTVRMRDPCGLHNQEPLERVRAERTNLYQ